MLRDHALAKPSPTRTKKNARSPPHLGVVAAASDADGIRGDAEGCPGRSPPCPPASMAAAGLSLFHEELALYVYIYTQREHEKSEQDKTRQDKTAPNEK